MSPPASTIPGASRTALRRRIWLPLAALVAILLAAIALGLGFLHEAMLEGQRERIRAIADNAQAIIALQHERQMAGTLSEAEARARAMDLLSVLHYGEGGYVFVYDGEEDRLIVHPDPRVRTMDPGALTDPDGVRILDELLRSAAAGGGFLTYRWRRPDGSYGEKLSHASSFQPWGWVIGTGLFLDEIRSGMVTAALGFGGLALLLIGAAGTAATVALRQVDRADDLQDARDRLLHILEATPDFVSMADMDRNVVYLSGGARRMLGLPETAPGSMGFDVPPAAAKAGEWLHPEWAARRISDEGIPTALARGSWQGESALIGADGQEIPVSQVIVAHFDPEGRPRHVSTIMRDVSGLRAVQKELAATAANLERVLNVTPAGIYVLHLDPDHPDAPPTCPFVSPTFVRISGYAAEAWAEAPRALWNALVPPEDKAAQEDWLTCLERDGRVESDYRIRRADGTLIWVLDTSVLLRDDAGRPVEIVGSWLDITERKIIEAELRRSNADLEQFAYAASHDLQEPLRMVGSYLNLLERRHGDRLDGEAREFMSFAMDGAARMHRMVRDLLTYSRVHTQGLPFTDVDVAAAVAGALSQLAASIDETGAVVVCGPLPTIRADATQIERLFLNLIGNAIKYRRPGTAPQVLVTCAETRHTWEFRVEDDGIGIAEQYRERVFQLFQRLHPREGVGGSGIGLAICKRIAERHGGHILLESEPGHGSTFIVVLAKEPSALGRAGTTA